MLRRATLAALLCLAWAGHASPRGHRGARKFDTAPAERVEVDCPVAVEGAGVVLARVGGAAITGCDLAIEWRRRRSAGLRVDDPRALLQGLVDDALRAEMVAAPPPPRRGDITRDRAVDAELAEALIRREALDALEAERPTDDEVRRYYDRHLDEFTTSERARVRQLLFLDREHAVAAIHALQQGTPFESLLPRSVDPLATRDEGDLGYIVRGGENEAFPPELIEPAWSLREPGDVLEAPVRVTSRATTTVIRRGRARTSVRRTRAWCVLQLVDRAPESVAPIEQARTRILHRLTRSDYLTERMAARARWEQQLAPQATQAIRDEGLGLVRLRAPDAP